MLIRLYHDNPEPRRVEQIVKMLSSGGVVIYPTDSVYAFCCSATSHKGVERLRALTGKDAKEFTLVFDTISRVAEYARVDNSAFKTLKRNLPGPFTFILEASGKAPQKTLEGRKNIGVRIQRSEIASSLVEALDSPLFTATLHDNEVEYTTDAELIEERWGDRVDAVVDSGIGNTTPSAIIDMTGDEPVVVREGAEEFSN